MSQQNLVFQLNILVEGFTKLYRNIQKRKRSVNDSVKSAYISKYINLVILLDELSTRIDKDKNDTDLVYYKIASELNSRITGILASWR